MKVYELAPGKRDREYKKYTESQIDNIVYEYLFKNDMSHKLIDINIIGIKPESAKGFESMNILHYIGIKGKHKGVFVDESIDSAIDILREQDEHHFKKIIECLTRLKNSAQCLENKYSWELLDNKILIKTIDEQILSNNILVPIEMMKFFCINNLDNNGERSINLIHNNCKYNVVINVNSSSNHWSTMSWSEDFTKLLKQKMYRYTDSLFNYNTRTIDNSPKIRFEAIDNTNFKVDFIFCDEILYDVEELVQSQIRDIETEGVIKEGTVKYSYGKRYERNTKNRIAAIEYHGTKCIVCNFDFESVYGERGRGYIEVHHVIPLSLVGKEIEINPKMDLVPVCSNCHKMIHRRNNDILTIEELKTLVKKNKEKEDLID